MPRLPALLALLATTLAFVLSGSAGAAEPAPHGAVVIAVGQGADVAAETLARAVYRDAELRPSIDEATARVLSGAAPPEGANAKLIELAAVRASLSQAGSEAALRRLLASIGAELRAALVVPVELAETAPRARVLRVDNASFLGTELVATRSSDADGSLEWPAAASVLRALTPRSETPMLPLATKPTPAKPAPKEATKEESTTSRTSLSSPWFWGGLGVLVAAGVSVFVVSRVEAGGDPARVHVQGRVAP